MRTRPEIESFAELMENKMAANDHKSSYKDMALGRLMKLLRQEVEELDKIVWDGVYRSIPAECADVANFAMMIAENARSLV